MPTPATSAGLTDANASAATSGAKINAIAPITASIFAQMMRRAEIGHHHHIAGSYLLRYAQEAAWREDNRRVSNGEQVKRLADYAIMRKPSVDFSGYWQRRRIAPL